ncbi:scavenger receptor cysteine-rich domain superfamily protein-like [Gigantopelta aegis]|uniref:scavenger receptor cysteine-rich domain superfamily protein-like n=1 Tax=Gigantopelta aegis TaxID=1735272 RepID=UPI001B889C94|nr:scavenger receptor cysteine-rich domain superfamily protein-like [Gigantopelta aegis]
MIDEVEEKVNSTVNCTYGDVRLMGGSTDYEGRVEVCINGVWGTVCDDSWGSSDATVVCKQLGYAYTGYYEGRVEVCINGVWGTVCDDSWGSSDATVVCKQLGYAYTGSPCANGDLRLAGGNVEHEGRVEICLGNVWGTICHDYWDNTDAQVVCSKLGYLKTVNSTVNCIYGDVRLVSGSTDYEGRVEVCINGVWGTVCDDSWGSSDATVVCKQLGYAYTGYAVAFRYAKFGYGRGSIYLDDVQCSGSETSLLSCSYDSHTDDCSHSHDAGVRCQVNSTVNCTYGDVRLVGGSTDYEGRVEVCINGVWGTVCDDSWGSSDATVVCKQLGYAYTGSPCANGDLRLAGGNVEHEGRVEICLGNVWGTICHDYWDNTDAQLTPL